MADDSFSLGAGLMGFPAAEGFAAGPGQQAPQELFASSAQEMAERSDVYAGLYTSSAAGRDWVLAYAPRARLRIDSATSLESIAVLAERLRKRGNLPTTLSVVCEDTYESGAVLAAITEQFQGASITDLQVSSTGPWHPSDQVVYAFLQRAGAAFPALTSLTLATCPCDIPPPVFLPHLTHLSVHIPVSFYVRFPGVQADSDEESESDYSYSDEQGSADDSTDSETEAEIHAVESVLRSIVPYVPQVTHLQITCTYPRPPVSRYERDPEVRLPWALVFTSLAPNPTPNLTQDPTPTPLPTTPTPTPNTHSKTTPTPTPSPRPNATPTPHIPTTSQSPITHFTTNGELTNELLGLLLDHAPQLEHLSVGKVKIIGDEFGGREWGVQRLHLGMQGASVLGSTLVSLPVNRGGVVVVEGQEDGLLCLAATGPQGLAAAVCARLPNWHFHLPTIWAFPEYHIPDSDHPAALRTLLTQLSHLHAPTAYVRLTNWDGTPETLQIGAAGLPALPHLRFELAVKGPVTDGLLGAVLDMGPVVRRLGMTYFKVESNQHSSAVWPWEEVSMHINPTFELAWLLRLPLAEASHGAARMVRCESVKLNCRDFTQESLTQLNDRLQHLVWATKSSVEDSKGLALHVHGYSPDTHVTLPDALSLLHSLKLSSTTLHNRTSVTLHDLPMTHDTMQTLEGLPSYGGQLDMRRCMWNWPRSKEYTGLAQCIPVSFGSWLVGGEVSVDVVGALCEGANIARAGEGLPRLEVTWELERPTGGVSPLLSNAERWEHVTVQTQYTHLF